MGRDGREQLLGLLPADPADDLHTARQAVVLGELQDRAGGAIDHDPLGCRDRIFRRDIDSRKTSESIRVFVTDSKQVRRSELGIGTVTYGVIGTVYLAIRAESQVSQGRTRRIGSCLVPCIGVRVPASGGEATAARNAYILMSTRAEKAT
jgi:hypothetical protein